MDWWPSCDWNPRLKFDLGRGSAAPEVAKESSLDVEMATQEQENSIKSADVRSDAI